jgi:hypothetical protein
MSGARRAILEVRGVHPPPPVRRVVLEPGEVLRVGRTDLADLQVSRDRQMSGVHFELSWDGARCQVRDRESARGTWLNGQQVSEGEVKNAGWIRAGDTIFMVFFEGATPGRLPVDSPEVTARKERALAAFAAEAAPLFALLDAARSPRVLELLRESVEEHQSLYDGVKGEALADVAPYLVRLPQGSTLLEKLVREGWGESWGLYLTSEAAFTQVRRHFRRILSVDVHQREKRPQRAYFRFYDPRVLRVLLPIINSRQAAELFGEIGCYLVEGEHGEVERFEAAAFPGGLAWSEDRSSR